MTCYTLGADCPNTHADDGGAATVPGPDVVPPEQTNI